MSELVNRRVTFKLYPNTEQLARLHEMLVLHQQLYNDMRTNRVEYYKWFKKIKAKRELTDEEKEFFRRKITRFGNHKDLTERRRLSAKDRELSSMSQLLTIDRLNQAFKDCSRRKKEGKSGRELGFPKYKVLERFPGFGCKKHGNGWKFTPGDDWKHGRLYLKSVPGLIRCRGRARTIPEEIRTCDLMHRGGDWFLSISVNCRPERSHGTAAAGMDWGVATFATLVTDNDEVQKISNERLLKSMEPKLKRAQRSLSRKQKGSSNRRKQRRRYARLMRHLTNQRRDFEHQASKRLIDRYAFIATEELNVKSMTASAKGTIEAPGKNVKRKAGLNRGVLDTSPNAFLQKLRYKMEESGGIWVDVPTRQVKPSQTCPQCGHQEKKGGRRATVFENLRQRDHLCGECGHTEPRDQAAARVMLQWAMKEVGSPLQPVE